MTKRTIIRSITGTSRLNPEPSNESEKKFNIHIGIFTIERFDIKDTTVQTINNNDGTVNQSSSNSNDDDALSCNEKIKQLNKEIEYLKTIVKDKERIIAFLEKDQS